MNMYWLGQVVTDLGGMYIYFECFTACPLVLGQQKAWQNGLRNWAGLI